MAKLRRLGQSDLYLSPLGLGTWQFGNDTRIIWNKVDGHLIRDILDYSLNHGINWLDTAEIYGRGTSESFLGQEITNLIKEKRIHEAPALATKWFPLLRSARTIDGAVSQQLKRLRTASIDLYQIHQPTSISSLHEQIKVLADLLHQHKIKNIGVSNFTAKQMIKADELLKDYGLRLVSNQVKYNLLDRHIERKGVLDAAKERGISLIAYSPLRQGYLTGRFHNNPDLINQVGLPRKLWSRMSKRNIEETRPLIELLRKIGQNYEKTPAQVALNWLIHAHGDTVLAIPGASKLSQAQSNVQAQDFCLSQTEIDQLDSLSRQVAIW